VSQVLREVQTASTRKLFSMLDKVLSESRTQITVLNRFKDDVLGDFLDQVNLQFQNLEAGISAHVSVDTEVVDVDSLKLVDNEELNVMLAVEGMVAYARNEHLPHFISLNTRMNGLFEGNPVNEASNPLDPEQIASAFTESTKQLGLTGGQSLQLYRQFNSGVLRKLDDVLTEANKILIDNGIIPNLNVSGASKPQQKKRVRRPQTDDLTQQFGQQEQLEPAADKQFTAETPELFSMMKDLLHEFREISDQKPNDMTGAELDSSESTGQPIRLSTEGIATQDLESGQVMDQQQLLTVLTEMQKTLAMRKSAVSPDQTDIPDEVEENRSLTETLREAQQEGTISPVDQNSSDIINLVSMLYKAIREDDSVPKPINELIDKTQISITKVALSDHNFFDKDDHPARALLNEFASASVGWIEEDNSEDPLYNKVEQSVERILREYDDNQELFEELLLDFRSFREQTDSEQHRKVSKHRSIEGESRLQDAKEVVTTTIQSRILGRSIDPLIEEVLQRPFSRFMVMLVLKQGTGSKAWKHAITTIDVLLWSVQSHDQAGDRQRLTVINPRLLNNLRKAFKIVNVNQHNIDSIITELRQLQEDSFPLEKEASQLPSDVDSDAVEVPVADAGEQLETSAQLSQGTDPDLTPVNEKSAIGTAGNPEAESSLSVTGAEEKDATALIQAEDLEAEPEEELDAEQEEELDVEQEEESDIEEDSEAVREEVEITQPAAAPSITDTDKDADTEYFEEELEERYLKQADDLAVGVWVEFMSGDDQTTRCKLAARIAAIDKLIFVNRQGVKVFETTRDRLAMELQQGTVSVISDGQLFSRALETVIGDLREEQHTQRTASAYQGAASA